MRCHDRIFDGVHRGHQFLISNVMEEARRSGLASLVITFDRHPRQVLNQDYQPQLLTTLERKLQLIALTGVDNVAVLRFSKEMAALSAKEFMRQVLAERLNVKTLVIGYDNRFGHDRTEGFDDYVAYGRELGIEVVQAKSYTLDNMKVSSSLIRSFLEGGEAEMAARCLSRPFELSGKVKKGFQEGRKLGFPTANLDLGDSGLLIPKDGVYAVWAAIDGHSRLFPAMMDIGSRPTFGGGQLSLEVNIIGFHGNLYDKQVKVRFVGRVRDNRKFDSADSLAEQLRKDQEYIIKKLNKESKENNNKDITQIKTSPMTENNNALRGSLDILWYAIVFLLLQLGFGAIFHFVKLQPVTSTIAITSLSSLATLLVFLKCKWARVSNTWLQTRPWAVIVWAVLLAVGSMIPSEQLVEWMHLEMPEEMTKMMEGVMKKPLGYVVIGILAPLAEEVVFRGAILRKLLAMMPTGRHWVAIAISALIFGIVHFNLPQGIHAFLIGLLLGWMYYRTRSIIPGIVFHWINNTISYIMVNLMPQCADGKLVDLFNGNERMVIYAVLFSMLIFLPSIFQLNIRMRKAKDTTAE